MLKLTVLPAVMMILAGACGNGPTPVSPPAPPPPPPAPWVVGLVIDSLTPASGLYASHSWAFFTVFLGTPNGLLSQGTLGRDDVGRFARCLGPARRFPGQTEVAYIALGDSMYSGDSAAYWRLMTRLAAGGDSMRLLFVSLARGDSSAVVPGLIVLSSPSFAPTAVSAFGRGATSQTALLRRWAWRDGGSTFAEDTAHASLTACGLD